MDGERHSAVLQSSVATSKEYKKKGVSGISLPGYVYQQTDLATVIMEECSTCGRLIGVNSNITYPH